jgi:hypothetical protein
MIGSQDLIVGLVLVLVLFDAKKLPELAGSIGPWAVPTFTRSRLLSRCFRTTSP